jgi:hypothetical protein
VFCGCLFRIEARNHSGWLVDDKVITSFTSNKIVCQFFIFMFILVSNVQITNACTLFKAEDKKHRKFAYLHCWKILKDKPKWLDRRKEIGSANKTSNKKQKTVANSSPASVAPAALAATDVAAVGGAYAEPSGRPD